MIEKEKNTSEKEQNEYAENIKGEVVFILDAESGRQGYFCIGCKNQMQAVKAKIIGRKSYFRHEATDIKNTQRECTFSNETYRHSLAKSILERIKIIKVPILYKYPPNNSSGLAYKLKDSEYIEAKYTKSELTFYEDDNGIIKYGKNNTDDIKNLLIKPDVTFFNAQNKPILFIEIVATHKLDQEKLAKIKRLGVNTVQIVIPKASEENIEKSFHQTKNIKWVYNYEEERTDYIQLSNKNSEGISQIDELQRQFFEETLECRQSQIRNLIRGLTKCLESEQYREIEQNFRAEISRTENNTSQAEYEFNSYRNGIRENIYRKFEQQFEQFESQKEVIGSQEIQFENYFEREKSDIKESEIDLETRYLKKAGELRELQSRIEGLMREETGRLQSENTLGEQLESKIKDTDNRIGRIREFKEKLPGEFSTQEKEEQSRYRRIKQKLEAEESELPKLLEDDEEKLRGEFDKSSRRIIDQIKNGDFRTDSELSIRIKKLFDARRILNDWDEARRTLERNRKAMECFRKGTFKNWN